MAAENRLAAVPASPRDTSGQLLQAQSEVLESIVRGQPLAGVLASLCRIVEAQATRPVRAAILLVDEAGERLYTGAAPSLPESYCAAIDGIAIEPDVGTCVAAAARREVVITPDIACAAGWAAFSHLPLELGLRAAWSMPILSSTGVVLGTFGTYFLETGEPTAQEKQLVEVLARTAALAIERRQADEAMRATAARDRFLADLAAATQPLTDPAAVMLTTARLLAEYLQVDRCAYAEIEDGREFVITGDHTRGVASIVGRWPIAGFGPACVSRMLSGNPFVVEDVDAHPQIGVEHLPSYRATQIRAVICVPLHKNGRLSAAMAVHQAAPRRWSAAQVELVTLVVARCWEALERARVTRTLQQSEARYRTIVEASPECVKLVDADGRLLQMNQAGLRMIEAPDESQALGRCVLDVIAPEHADAFRELNARVCRGERGTLAFEIVGLGGTRRWMETTAVPLAAPEGGYVQLAVTRDVTARMATERALAQHRARLDYAVRLSGVGFWYCDLPFDELVWDERVKEHFFLPPDARVTIELFYDRIHPEDRDATRAAIEASIREHTSYDVTYRTVDPASGAVKFVRALGGTAYDPRGAPIHFDGVTVDVTAQKLDQERMAALLRREQTQARLLQQVTDSALTIHAADTLEAVLRVFAEEARRIIGAHQAVTSVAEEGSTRQRINTVSLSDKYAAYRDYAVAPNEKGIYAVVARTNRPMRLTQAQLEAHASFRHFSGEGARHPPMRGWLAVPLIARGGANLGLVQLSDKYEGEFTEVDEVILVQLAQIAAVALENAGLYDQLRDSDRRKDEFLATLAHELRNPLAPIRTGLHVLQLNNDAEQAARTRQMMERQLGHLVRMVDDLLDVSRITLGKLTLRTERTDFRHILHSALETAMPLIETRGHELAMRIPKDPLPLDVDATRVAQVIANLLNNAAKYTPPNGRIQLAAGIEHDALVVRVSDSGVGIPRDMLGQVFEMFTQVNRATDQAQGGLGIGLTLVRRLVELHGGSIEADSEGPGQGSTFTVRLPLAGTAPAAFASDDARHDGAAASTLRILVVDDNVDAAESLAMLLQISGHATQLAHGGPEALQASAAFDPDVVLLDIGLPGLNGYEVAERLRKSGSRRPFLVALTGWGSEEDRRLAQQAGFDRHLVKPVEISLLQQVIQQAVSREEG